jgi:hypothetical protein
MPKPSKATVASLATSSGSDDAKETSTVWFRATFMPFHANEAWREEALRFARRRLDHNREAVLRLTKCNSWQDLLELQVDWSREIFEDYLAESREMLELVTRSTNGENGGDSHHRRGDVESMTDEHRSSN